MIGKLLGLDHGLARIGVAVSDPTGLVARELTIIQRTSKAADFERIRSLAAEQAVVALVVGIPYSDGPADQFTQADKVRNWLAHLRSNVSLPVIEWDEQLSSDDARSIAQQQGRSPQAPIDDLAARVILQSYLNALHDGLAPLPPRNP